MSICDAGKHVSRAVNELLDVMRVIRDSETPQQQVTEAITSQLQMIWVSESALLPQQPAAVGSSDGGSGGYGEDEEDGGSSSVSGSGACGEEEDGCSSSGGGNKPRRKHRACLFCGKTRVKLQKCSACLAVYSCSQECFVKAWPKHKAACQKQATAAAAACLQAAAAAAEDK